MKKHKIPLESFIPKGKVSLKIDNSELLMTSEGIEGRLRSGKKSQTELGPKFDYYCAYIPDKFKLPFRVDMAVKANSRRFKWRIGKGNIDFVGTFYWANGEVSGIHRVDILTGKDETAKYDYENNMPLNEYADISVVYGTKKMWVELDVG